MNFENLYLILLAGPSNITLNSKEYIILLVASVLVGKFLGGNRYIGSIWSAIFFFFMPLLCGLGLIFSLTIIFTSPKLSSKPPKGTSGKLNLAMGLILFSLLGLLGLITSELHPISIEDYLKNGQILFGIELLLFSAYLIWIYIKYPVKNKSN